LADIRVRCAVRTLQQSVGRYTGKVLKIQILEADINV